MTKATTKTRLADQIGKVSHSPSPRGDYSTVHDARDHAKKGDVDYAIGDLAAVIENVEQALATRIIELEARVAELETSR